jgi:hypothetical protein
VSVCVLLRKKNGKQASFYQHECIFLEVIASTVGKVIWQSISCLDDFHDRKVFKIENGLPFRCVT